MGGGLNSRLILTYAELRTTSVPSVEKNSKRHQIIVSSAGRRWTEGIKMKNEFVIRDEAMTLPVLPKEQRIQLDNVDESFEEGWRQALENLAILPAADVVERPRWIPVTERLPEKRKWVLCRCEANIIEVLRWENNEWYHDPMHVYYPSFVTHWQPLPDLPEEET